MITRINKEDLIKLLQKLECKYVSMEESKSQNKISIYPEIYITTTLTPDINELIA